MKELQQIVNAQLETMIANGAIEKAINEAVENSVTKALEDQFRSYGEFSKSLEGMFKEKLRVDTGAVSIPTYEHHMVKLMNQVISRYMKGEAYARFEKMADEAFSELPAEMDIHTFVDKIVKFWRDSEEYDKEGMLDDATVTVEASSWCRDNSSHNLTVSSGEDSFRYASGGITKEKVELYISNGAIRCNHSFDPYDNRGLEGFIYRLYAQGVKITGMADFDEDKCDLTIKQDEWD